MTTTSTQPTKQQLRTKKSTNRLLGAAAEILVEQGVSALTLANVGERAGFSRGLVTTRFGSKDNMIKALVQRLTTRWAVTHIDPRVKDKSGLDSLLEMMREMRDQIARGPSDVLALQVLLFDALSPASSARAPILEYNTSLRRAFAANVRLGVEDGTIRPDVDPGKEARWLLECIRGIGFHWLLTSDTYDPVVALAHSIAVAEARLSAKAG